MPYKISFEGRVDENANVLRDVTMHASDARFFDYLKAYPNPGQAVVISLGNALLDDKIVKMTTPEQLGSPQELQVKDEAEF